MSRREVSTRVIGSMIAVVAGLALAMATIITLLMTLVPDTLVSGVPSVPADSAAAPLESAPPETIKPWQELERLLTFSMIALVLVTAVGAVAVRWTVRRALAPLSAMIVAAERAAATDLGGRIPVGRVQDEVTDLAVTFNTMLARLDAAFEAQRRFAANASHELQTPLATTQAILDDALADTPEGPQRQLLHDLRTLNSRSSRTVRTLLDLADAQAGRGHHEPVDLSAIVGEEVTAHESAARARDVTIHHDLEPLVTEGDPALIRLMVRNLIDNAVRHNHRGGRVELCVRTGEGLLIVNTGSPLTVEEVARIVEPFHRGAGRLRSESTGLGAALVAAVVNRHGWRLHLRPGADGGLVAEVRIQV
ncbi:sensor histidine kinase [Actinoplanes couchii]|uniref:histidine kinase n=1 Tax=Actinoplanes couchii TaxID=403638 RepID=A0ABQ3XSC9_9ACTN|nr:HAMP domain-containing sensor histidine kinase [Actinoplanes couchii]MDR6318754.1 two-component system sensor histidine kinase VanS [Actinoplanes couchii]GID61282.1 two-component sensor histidine kinase [Actinoplanes couchii]